MNKKTKICLLIMLIINIINWICVFFIPGDQGNYIIIGLPVIIIISLYMFYNPVGKKNE